MSVKEWEAKVYELEAQIEELPLQRGNEQLFLLIQQLRFTFYYGTRRIRRKSSITH